MGNGDLGFGIADFGFGVSGGQSFRGSGIWVLGSKVLGSGFSPAAGLRSLPASEGGQSDRKRN